MRLQHARPAACPRALSLAWHCAAADASTAAAPPDPRLQRRRLRVGQPPESMTGLQHAQFFFNLLDWSCAQVVAGFLDSGLATAAFGFQCASVTCYHHPSGTNTATGRARICGLPARCGHKRLHTPSTLRHRCFAADGPLHAAAEEAHGFSIVSCY